MRSIATYIAFIFAASISQVGHAKSTIAVGTVAEKSLGASILYLQNPFQGFHLALQKDTNQSYTTTIDFHQYFSVRGAKAVIGAWAHLASYVGIGIRSRATIAAEENDSIGMRAPVGFELSLKAFPVQILGDVAIELSPSDLSAPKFTPRVGARAVF